MYPGKAYEEAGVLPGDVVSDKKSGTQRHTVVAPSDNKVVRHTIHRPDPDEFVYVTDDNTKLLFCCTGSYFSYYYNIIERGPTHKDNTNPTDENACPHCGCQGHWVSLALVCKKCHYIFG